jgi:hypothetical protein
MRCREFIALLWEPLYPPKEKITNVTVLPGLNVVKPEKNIRISFSWTDYESAT